MCAFRLPRVIAELQAVLSVAVFVRYDPVRPGAADHARLRRRDRSRISPSPRISPCSCGAPLGTSGGGFSRPRCEGPHWNYKLYKYLCKFDEQITLPSDHPRASSRGTGSTRSLAFCSLSGVYIYYGFFPLWRFSHTEGVIAIDFESIRREARGSSILILETLSSLPIRF